MTSRLKPIQPETPRWEPTPDPNDIVVPGLDSTAPPYDQIEQIEQLITIKLQNIDANFSKIQNAMANKILPAVKRYSVGVQPVREAAKFWTTFYEQAAQIRIPTYDDYSTTDQQEDEPETTHSQSDSALVQSPTNHSPRSESETPATPPALTADETASEVSFAPGQAAVSSTPATAVRTRFYNNASFASDTSEPMPSWNSSLESPLLQLNRDIKSLSEHSVDVEHTSTAAQPSDPYDDSADITQRPNIQPLAQDKGKARGTPKPLLHNVLRRNANSSAITSSSSSTTTSPLKFKPKTPSVKNLNPYIPLDSKPSDWAGVVDLKDPSISSPRRNVPSSSMKRATSKPPGAIGLARVGTKTPPPPEDESFDDNFGMSPPVMTDYARLPKLGQTPKQVAAGLITQSLVDVERRSVFAPPSAVFQRAPGTSQGKAGVPGSGTKYGTESSMSSMPTPPSMTRYARSSQGPAAPAETSESVADASLDSMMRRVGLNVSTYHKEKPTLAAPPTWTSQVAPVPGPSKPVFSTIPATVSAPSVGTLSSSKAQQPPPLFQSLRTPDPPVYDDYDNEIIGRPGTNADDSLDSMDSIDYGDPGVAPGTDFLFAPEGQEYDDDDSFDSSLAEDDELTDGTAAPFILAPADDDSFDDSFDADYEGGEEETVFGVTPAQRLLQEAQAGNLRMLGQDLLQDTIGIGSQMALTGRVEESPTPWNNGND